MAFQHVKLALKNTFCGKLDALVLALLKEAFDKKEITIEFVQVYNSFKYAKNNNQ